MRCILEIHFMPLQMLHLQQYVVCNESIAMWYVMKALLCGM